MKIVFLGPPGAGKGSQASLLVKEKSFYHLSTGDMFREALNQKTPLGLKVENYMKEGLLVPDDLTLELVQEVFQKISNKHLILDGFPRTLVQATALDKMLEKNNEKLDRVIYFDISDDEVIDRLSGRRWALKSRKIYHIKYKKPRNEGYCDETGEKLVQREDDKEEVINKRLKVFRQQSLPLLDYYASKKLLTRISANESSKEMFKSICDNLKKL